MNGAIYRSKEFDNFMMDQLLSIIKAVERSKDEIRNIVYKKYFSSPLSVYIMEEKDFKKFNKAGYIITEHFRELEMISDTYPDMFCIALKKLNIEDNEYVQRLNIFMDTVSRMFLVEKERRGG